MTLLTLTGIDARTSSDWMRRMRRRWCVPSGYSALEFAILRSPSKVGRSPRYLSSAECRAISAYSYPDGLAYHLCGGYSAMVLVQSRWDELRDAVDFDAVSRVQVNLPPADDNDDICRNALQLARFSVYLRKPVIFQWRDYPIPYFPGIQLLQDRSGGRGIAETRWSSPDAIARKAGARFGYAGGLSPENIVEQVPRMVAAARRQSFWMDCESCLRNEMDQFCTERAELMIERAMGALGIAPRD